MQLLNLGLLKLWRTWAKIMVLNALGLKDSGIVPSSDLYGLMDKEINYFDTCGVYNI